MHGNAYAESSITFPLVILPEPSDRHMALLMAKSHDPPFSVLRSIPLYAKSYKKATVISQPPPEQKTPGGTEAIREL